MAEFFMIKNFYFVLLALSIPSLAHAKGIYLSAQAGSGKTTPADNRSTQYSPASTIPFGVDFGVASGTGLGFGLGATYLPRSYTVDSKTITSTWLQVPLTLRYWLGSAFSVGVAAYYAKTMGAFNSSTGGTTTDLNYDRSGLKKTDIGAFASAMINLFPFSTYGFTFEAKYGGSILNAASTGEVAYKDIILLAGFRVGGF